MSDTPNGTSGKWVVAALLVLGVSGAVFLSRNIPRGNRKETVPGSPYYSKPSDEEIQRAKAEPKQK